MSSRRRCRSRAAEAPLGSSWRNKVLICGVEEVRSERERLFVQSGLLPSGDRLEELIWPPDAKLSGVSAFVE